MENGHTERIEATPRELYFNISNSDTNSESKTQRLSLVNTNSTPLFFKLLSNAHERYVLSRTKGVLQPGETIHVDVQLMLNKTPPSGDCKDTFKLQYFKQIEDGPLGQVFVPSFVHSNTDARLRSVRRTDSVLTRPKQQQGSTRRSDTVYVAGKGSAPRTGTIKRKDYDYAKAYAYDSNGYYLQPGSATAEVDHKSKKRFILISFLLCVFLISLPLVLPLLVRPALVESLQDCSENGFSVLSNFDQLNWAVMNCAWYLHSALAGVQSQCQLYTVSAADRWQHFKQLIETFSTSAFDLACWIFTVHYGLLSLLSNLGWLGLGATIIYWIAGE